MPFYEYQCPACSHRFEVRRGMKDDAVVKCPECGAEARRVFSAPAMNTWKARILPPTYVMQPRARGQKQIQEVPVKVKFGVLFVPHELDQYVEAVKEAERLGYDRIGIPDSQSIFRELYVASSLVATNTRRVKFGPRVTNPLTRHPAVTASAVASLDEISGGRALLGISVGDSAVLNLGLRPARLDTLKEYILAVKELFERKETTYRGRTVKLTWPKRRVPIYVAASGPRALRLAGQVADGVIVAGGLWPEVIQESLGYVKQGAEDARRDFHELDIWHMAIVSLAETRQQAVERIKMTLAAARNVADSPIGGKYVPKHLVEPFRKLGQMYSAEHHVIPGAGNVSLTDQLGLTEFVTDWFTISGTAADCVKKVEQIRQAGVSQIWFSVHFHERIPFIQQWAEKVMATFSQEPIR